MKKLVLVILVSVALLGQVHAQGYAFKVLVNKGKNEIKSGDGWQAIKVGTSLQATDEIKVTDNAYLGLVHATGKPLEVKTPGKHKVSELAAQIGGGSSVLNKYTDFILSSNSTKKNSLSATGAVHRGIPKVHIYLPTSSQGHVIYNDEVIINWDKKFAGPYVVKFNSLFEDELDKVETTENTLKVNLAKDKFVNEDNILVTVAPKADPNKISEGFTLRRLSKADKERIKTALKEFEGAMQEQTPLNKLLLAGFYEQNGLLIDAATAYLEAIKLAPDVPNFQEDYNNFIIRNGLNENTEKK